MWWSLCAWAWAPSEPRSLVVTPAAQLAVTRVGERPVLLMGGEQGLSVRDLSTSEELARSGEPLLDLWVGDADGDGGSDVIGCGPGGVWSYQVELGEAPFVLRTVVAEIPCEAVDTVDTPSGQALLVVSGGVLQELFPSLLGPRYVPYPEVVPQRPPKLATSGSAVAMVTDDAALWRRIGPASGTIAQEPVLAVESWAPAPEPRFAALRGGESPELVLPSGAIPVEGGATGLVASAERLWVLDEVNRRLGVPGTEAITWFPAPVSPKLAFAADLDGDGCEELVLSDGTAEGALLPGDCRPVEVSTEEVPEFELPPRSQELELRDEWPIVHIRVGEPVLLQLRDAETGWSRFSSRGGPPGFAVMHDGEVEFRAESEDVGRWRVSVRTTSDNLVVRWTGFELAVWPSEGQPALTSQGPGPSEAGLDEPEEPEPEQLSEPSPLQGRPGRVGVDPQSYALRRCLLGMGLAGGAARAGGSTWENLGAADIRGGLSPHASVGCSFGNERSHFAVGFDSAPYFRYGDVPQDRRHLLALSASVDIVLGATSLGVMGSIGSTSRGLGPRVLWMGLRDWKDDPMGLEARALWLAPKVGAEISLAWAWTL